MKGQPAGRDPICFTCGCTIHPQGDPGNLVDRLYMCEDVVEDLEDEIEALEDANLELREKNKQLSMTRPLL